jgi:hypothetical protein
MKFGPVGQHLSTLDLNEIVKLTMDTFFHTNLEYLVLASCVCDLQAYRDLCVFDEAYQEQLDDHRAEYPWFPYPPL